MMRQAILTAVVAIALARSVQGFKEEEFKVQIWVKVHARAIVRRSSTCWSETCRRLWIEAAAISFVNAYVV